MNNISSCALSFDFSYLPQTRLQTFAVNSGGIGWWRTYENGRDLVVTVSNFCGASVAAVFPYTNDVLGRRVARNADTFGYNARSEVTGESSGSDVRAYAYDAVGNRVWSAENAATNTYTVNSLNQYTAITGGAPCYPSYDPDGNMLTNGVWSYAWDAENRMRGAVSNGVPAVSNAYDHRHRRVRKATAAGTCLFAYDGWNLTAEVFVDSQTGATNVTRYLWGPDLSGTLQGAGGVGGLLAEIRGDGSVYYPCYDANGNVTDYVDAYGTVRGHFEYDAFGNTVAMWGDIAHTFKFRFSTKYWDDETGLYYYGYRFYAPKIGCWLSRDPLKERGGSNLYGFVGNNPVSRFDPWGCETFSSITIKRKHVKWLALLKERFGKTSNDEDTYGHWWIEFDGESYGWWPKDAVGLVDTLVGVPGELNGQTSFGGTLKKDPHHGDSADESFHPNRSKKGKLEVGELVGGTSCKCASESEIKQCIRAFATIYSGLWSYPWGQNCHSFQRGAMNSCCLKK